jgi:hypothetical protein
MTCIKIQEGQWAYVRGVLNVKDLAPHVSQKFNKILNPVHSFSINFKLISFFYFPIILIVCIERTTPAIYQHSQKVK